jgi:hypothetical protein
MPDPIRFDVSNPQTPDAGAVIYISDDAEKWGRLDITLTNPSTDNSDLKLDSSGVLQIYLEMLTPDDIKNITLPDGSAWAGGPDNTNRHLELHPKQTITIPSKSSISIELHNVFGQAPRQGKFRFYDESLGIKNAVVQGFVQRPPGDAAKPWGLACILDPRAQYQNQGNTVYVTRSGKPEIANHLLVHLYRSAGGTLPSTGTPQLSFSLLTGDDDLALCSDERLKAVSASIQDQQPQGRWKDPAKDGQGADWIWTVDPADGGGDLFPENGLLTLKFDDIVTDLPPGNSTLFIHYTGLTGYDDGHLQVPISKINPVPYVNYFRARANGEIVGANATVNFLPLMLEWDVFAADSCLLQSDDGSGAQQMAVSGNKPLVARPLQTYTLQPQIGNETLAGTDVRFSVTPPVAAITTGPDGFIVNWECTGISADNHCVLLEDEGNQRLDYPLSSKTRVNGRDLLTTGPQTYFAVHRSMVTLGRQGGGPEAGGIEASVAPCPTIDWSCSNGDHCVLYANGARIADGLPLSKEMPALPGTTYTIECIGAGSTSATMVVDAAPANPAAARLNMTLGEGSFVDWSIENATQYLFSEDGPDSADIAKGVGSSTGKKSYQLGTKYWLYFIVSDAFLSLWLTV